MRNTYTREKRTLCGESYMEVDLYAITPEEHRAKRRKKCRPSSERQKRRNAQHAHRRRGQKSNANFTVLGFYLTLTYAEEYLPVNPMYRRAKPGPKAAKIAVFSRRM